MKRQDWSTPIPLAVLFAAIFSVLSGCHALPPPEPSPDDVCGGLTGAGCPSGEFCNFPEAAQCGAADQTGVCEAIPEGCTKEYAPVCGCDDKTYGNACMAYAAGVSVATQGECATPNPDPDPNPNPGKTCGGIAALPCDEGDFCNYEPAAGGQGCDGTIADAAGVCQPKPEDCTKEYAPVCGCDGETYGNACIAHAAGASVASEGECKVAADGVSCDRRELRCKRAEPVCPDFQVPSIVDHCFGPCVPIEACVCDEPEDCATTDSYTCHRYKGRCGPYI